MCFVYKRCLCEYWCVRMYYFSIRLCSLPNACFCKRKRVLSTFSLFVWDFPFNVLLQAFLNLVPFLSRFPLPCKFIFPFLYSLPRLFYDYRMLLSTWATAAAAATSLIRNLCVPSLCIPTECYTWFSWPSINIPDSLRKRVRARAHRFILSYIHRHFSILQAKMMCRLLIMRALISLFLLLSAISSTHCCSH